MGKVVILPKEQDREVQQDFKVDSYVDTYQSMADEMFPMLERFEALRHSGMDAANNLREAQNALMEWDNAHSDTSKQDMENEMSSLYGNGGVQLGAVFENAVNGVQNDVERKRLEQAVEKAQAEFDKCDETIRKFMEDPTAGVIGLGLTCNSFSSPEMKALVGKEPDDVMSLDDMIACMQISEQKIEEYAKSHDIDIDLKGAIDMDTEISDRMGGTQEENKENIWSDVTPAGIMGGILRVGKNAYAKVTGKELPESQELVVAELPDLEAKELAQNASWFDVLKGKFNEIVAKVKEKFDEFTGKKDVQVESDQKDAGDNTLDDKFKDLDQDKVKDLLEVAYPATNFTNVGADIMVTENWRESRLVELLQNPEYADTLQSISDMKPSVNELIEWTGAGLKQFDEKSNGDASATFADLYTCSQYNPIHAVAASMEFTTESFRGEVESDKQHMDLMGTLVEPGMQWGD